MSARYRILIVDDNEVTLAVVGDLLEQAGHSVVTAEDGPSALSIVRDSRFDLILLDMRMPGMDGIEVAEAIRASVVTQAVPILLLTATLVPEDEPRWRRAGVLGCLVKPFRIGDLAPFLPAIAPASPPGSVSTLVAVSDLAVDLATLGHERMVGLADLFHRSSGADLERLLALAGEGRVTEAGAMAHRMAGAAASLHLHPLSALCREIESAARVEDSAAVAVLVEDVSVLWRTSLDALMEALTPRG